MVLCSRISNFFSGGGGGVTVSSRGLTTLIFQIGSTIPLTCSIHSLLTTPAFSQPFQHSDRPALTVPRDRRSIRSGRRRFPVRVVLGQRGLVLREVGERVRRFDNRRRLARGPRRRARDGINSAFPPSPGNCAPAPPSGPTKSDQWAGSPIAWHCSTSERVSRGGASRGVHCSVPCRRLCARESMVVYSQFP